MPSSTQRRCSMVNVFWEGLETHSTGAAVSWLHNGRRGVAPAPWVQLYVRCTGSCRAARVGAVLLCLWLGPRWHRVQCDECVVCWLGACTAAWLRGCRLWLV